MSDLLLHETKDLSSVTFTRQCKLGQGLWWRKAHIFSTYFPNKLANGCPVGHHEWIEYLYSKVFIETIHSEVLRSSGWLLSFLWAFQWIRCLAPVCGELRALIIRVLSSGSCPLWRHFLLKPPLTPSIHPPFYLPSFFSLSFPCSKRRSN